MIAWVIIKSKFLVEEGLSAHPLTLSDSIDRPLHSDFQPPNL